MIVVEKGHPRKFFFPALDPGKIREELKLSNSKKLLLLSAWTHDEEIRLFRMHPEVLSWDITKKTIGRRETY
jgi:hypothetical protein